MCNCQRHKCSASFKIGILPIGEWTASGHFTDTKFWVPEPLPPRTQNPLQAHTSPTMPSGALVSAVVGDDNQEFSILCAAAKPAPRPHVDSDDEDLSFIRSQRVPADDESSQGSRSYRNNSNKLCQYFLEGRCRFGVRCWHSHDTAAAPPVRASSGTPPSVGAANPYAERLAELALGFSQGRSLDALISGGTGLSLTGAGADMSPAAGPSPAAAAAPEISLQPGAPLQNFVCAVM